MKKRHRIQFPKRDTEELDQDEIYFYLVESAGKKMVRFHDYDVIWQQKGIDRVYMTLIMFQTFVILMKMFTMK